jgi:hypothetical protein
MCLRLGYTLSPTQSPPFNLLWQPIGNFLTSIYYSTSHRHAVYEALSNSKKQGVGPIEEFLPRSGKCEIPISVCCSRMLPGCLQGKTLHTRITLRIESLQWALKEV